MNGRDSIQSLLALRKLTRVDYRRRPSADDRISEDADAAHAPEGGARRLRARRPEGTEPQSGQGIR